MVRKRASLSIFTRFPEPGECKTRLIGSLGTQGAADLQKEMTGHVVRQARILAATDPVRITVRVTGRKVPEVRGRFRSRLRLHRRFLPFTLSGVPCVDQGDGNLGDRLERALAEGLRGSSVSAVVGGDCPTLDAQDMREAVREADTHGAALVPAADGGFCLLAVTNAFGGIQGLLWGVEWGSDRVAQQTRCALRRHGVDAAVLEPRTDVDRPEDIAAWDAVRREWHARPQTLSVVVPTLNEEENLLGLLEVLVREPVEVLVVDGGSTDSTLRVANEAGVAVIACGLAGDPAGNNRAAQMNAGAAAASADALLFLHADTIPPEGFPTLVREALAERDVLLGAFRFSVGAGSPAMRLIEWSTNLRTSCLHLPYGDQGLFMRKSVWRAFGGYPEIPVMEDYELVRSARRAGRVAIVDAEALTSNRRWQSTGPLRYTVLNTATIAAHHLGVSPGRLAAVRSRYSKR